MPVLPKKTISAQYAQAHQRIFSCPVCGLSMEVVNQQRLTCANGHSFDFAKQGYLNLLANPPKTKYDRELFEARRHVMRVGKFFDPMLDVMAKAIAEHQGDANGNETSGCSIAANLGDTTSHNAIANHNTAARRTQSQDAPVTILDIGCGEGTHLDRICAKLDDQLPVPAIGVGMDISKEGILEAAKYYSQKIWCVADLARPPFATGQFDAILNILSPSNYTEFDRLLAPDGLLLKVVPQSGYLHELREFFYQNTDKESYSNDLTVERFGEFYAQVERHRVTYQVRFEEDMLRSLLHMTPLTWSVPQKEVETFLEKAPATITVDLELLVGQK